MPDGLIILNKPGGISSAAAVNRVKRLLPRGTKIGHAGTLDPFATGVLVLLIGKSTKSSEKIMGLGKQYLTIVKLDAITATDDREMPEQPICTDAAVPSVSAVAAVAAQFVGQIKQTPPVYSAMKISGRRACDWVRKGHEVTMQPRLVRIDAVDILEYQWPLLKLRIDCGRGTYIRSLGKDIGAALGVGGYLTELCRTRIGPYRLEESATLEALTADGIEKHLIADES